MYFNALLASFIYMEERDCRIHGTRCHVASFILYCIVVVLSSNHQVIAMEASHSTSLYLAGEVFGKHQRAMKNAHDFLFYYCIVEVKIR